MENVNETQADPEQDRLIVSNLIINGQVVNGTNIPKK